MSLSLSLSLSLRLLSTHKQRSLVFGKDTALVNQIIFVLSYFVRYGVLLLNEILRRPKSLEYFPREVCDHLEEQARILQRSHEIALGKDGDIVCDAPKGALFCVEAFFL